MKTAWAIFVGIVIGGLGGVGSFQLATAGTVSMHTVEIKNLQESFREERSRTDNRIFALTEMMNRTLDQNKEFIVLLREQNAIYKELLKAK